MLKMRLRPGVHFITLCVSEGAPLEQNEFHAHARLIDVRSQQLRLLNRVGAPQAT